jgi:hypothetical protein
VESDAGTTALLDPSTRWSEAIGASGSVNASRSSGAFAGS